MTAQSVALMALIVKRAIAHRTSPGNVRSTRLTGRAVALILKRAAADAGIEERQISSHSLRAGFVTEAKKHGADDAAIMDQTGHKSLAMVQRYHRRAKK